MKGDKVLREFLRSAAQTFSPPPQITLYPHQRPDFSTQDSETMRMSAGSRRARE